MERQRWPEKPLILGKSGTQYVAMVTKLLGSYCGAHLAESCGNKSNVSDSVSEISFLIRFDQNLGVYDVITLTNLHNFKIIERK